MNFETRVGDALGRYADLAPVDVDPTAMTRVAAQSSAGTTIGDRLRTTFGRSSTSVLILLAVLAAAAIGSIVVGSRLIDTPPRLRPAIVAPGPSSTAGPSVAADPSGSPAPYVAADPSGGPAPSGAPVTVLGVFERTGEFPPITGNYRYIDTAAVLADGRVLVTGMFSSGESGDTWAFMYDPATGTWSATGREPEYRANSTATTLLDGRVLIVGGWRVDTEGRPVLPTVGQIYDPATGRFEATRGSLATPRYDHTATLLQDGRVLITGGAGPDFNASQPQTASAEIFDPATGTFSSTGSMSAPRELHAATRLADGRVLITGGTSSREILSTASAEIFDPTTGAFSRVGSMRDARSWHGATLLADGRVLVVGGSGIGADPSSRTPLASAELFDPASGSFSVTGSLATERSSPGLLRLPGGRVLVAGGSNSFGGPRSAELFDPERGGFDPAGSSASPHGGGWAGLLPNGHVLVLGSVQDPMSNGVPEVWSRLESPAPPPPIRGWSKAFTPLDTSTDVLRIGQTATPLADGRILVTGGSGVFDANSKPLASAEILDPQTGRSHAVGSMAMPRSGHVAVLLSDGRVLVVGGEAVDCPPAGGRCTWPVPTAEIFDPQTARFTTLAADLGAAQTGTFGAVSLAAVLLADGRVLSYSPTRSATIIDPVTGDATRGPSIPGSGALSLVRLSDGRIFVQSSSPDPVAYILDATAYELTEVTQDADWDAAVGLAEGRILVVDETGHAAIFDPSTATFTRTGSMTPSIDPGFQDRYGQQYRRRLTLLLDGRVLITGGQTVGTQKSLDDAILYDPSSGMFTSVGPMHDPRFQQTVTVLDDGRAVIIGGATRSADRTDPEPAAVEVFDPARLP